MDVDPYDTEAVRSAERNFDKAKVDLKAVKKDAVIVSYGACSKYKGISIYTLSL